MKNFLYTGMLAALGLLCGCQAVTKAEFYEPTPTNTQYCTPASETTQGHGPLKLIEGKSGMPDFSDHKSFSFKFNVLGL